MEGLAYLTFDADVKEEFVEDKAALKALFQLSQVAPGSVVTREPSRLPRQTLANGARGPREGGLAAGEVPLCGMGILAAHSVGNDELS